MPGDPLELLHPLVAQMAIPRDAVKPRLRKQIVDVSITDLDSQLFLDLSGRGRDAHVFILPLLLIRPLAYRRVHLVSTTMVTVA